MNINIDNFINEEAKSVEEIQASIAAAQKEAKAIEAQLKALRKEGKVKAANKKAAEAKLYATPQYDFLDAEAKSYLESLTNWKVKNDSNRYRNI